MEIENLIESTKKDLDRANDARDKALVALAEAKENCEVAEELWKLVNNYSKMDHETRLHFIALARKYFL